jgi:hypothetical protein
VQHGRAQHPHKPAARRQAARQTVTAVVDLLSTRFAPEWQALWKRKTILPSSKIGAASAGTLGIIGKVCAAHRICTPVLGVCGARGESTPDRCVFKLCNKVLHPYFTTHADKFKNN